MRGRLSPRHFGRVRADRFGFRTTLKFSALCRSCHFSAGSGFRWIRTINSRAETGLRRAAPFLLRVQIGSGVTLPNESLRSFAIKFWLTVEATVKNLALARARIRGMGSVGA